MNETKICRRCILDSDVPSVVFDDSGMCNYCGIHNDLEKKYPLNKAGQQKLNQLVDTIKNKGKNKKHDCIVGISGGTDSTYTLYMTKKLGLRPLAVHFDNGWNSEIAIDNMKNAVEKLGVDFRTVTCNMEEFKDLQLSFLKASVSDAEIPTDIAIHSVLYRVAAQEGIRYVMNGHSFRTEGTNPLKWTYMDGKYIKSVHKKFGKIKLKTFPNLTISNLLYYAFIKRIQTVRPLVYLDYDKGKVKEFLKKNLDWVDYGGHHYESIYSRFVASYLLPKKFKIDKRKIEYSALIRSGQMTREDTLEKVKENPYSKEKVREDIEYIIKKLGITEEEFEVILSLKHKSFLDYPTYYQTIKKLKFPIRLACKFNLLPWAFYNKYFL